MNARQRAHFRITKSKPSKQLAVRPKERMWSVEVADRNLVGDDASKTLAGKPAVEMEGRRFDLERGLAQFCQIKIDGVIGRRTDRGRYACEHRQRRAVNVAGGDALPARMAPDDGGELAGIAEILAVH